LNSTHFINGHFITSRRTTHDCRPTTHGRRLTTSLARVLLLVAVAAIPWPAPAAAQPAPRRAVDIASLAAYPGFYHGQPILLRAEIIQTGNTTVLVHPEEPRALRVTSGGAPPPPGRVEARGVFWDLGRLKPDDPRVTSANLQALVDPGAESDWPKPGELFALQLTDAFPVNIASPPTLRDVVLDASQYVDQEVTLTGQFRGRNLYGDLPQAPGVSRWDFVLKSADAALWITGTQPRGRGFDLNPSARIDTSRWLAVSGIVKRGRGLVWLESVKIAAAQAPAALPAPETALPAVGPPPVVVFSAPTQGESDVSLETRVRLQFSRDMEAASFKDQIRLSYVASEAAERGEPPTPAPAFTSSYDAATRSLTIRFTDPLPPTMRFRTLNVQLLGGIKATDGAPMVPWTLSFVLGGS